MKRKNENLNTISKIQAFLNSSYKSPKVNLGQIQAYLNNQKSMVSNLAEVEFQVFSQWGDDGIIQYLINKIDVPHKTFIEFGVENYIESNTRFLIVNNNWTGYVIDGSPENIRFIKNDIISWACELYAKAAFINSENINALLSEVNFHSEIGILSIDIDGNDYWVWEAINVINPVIVITEYNSLFGHNTLWTIPYDPEFVRGKPHTNLYYGASLGALSFLGNKKGYTLIGCNSKGNNAYFIRNDKLGNFPARKVKEAYVLSKFREANIDGEWISGINRLHAINGLPIVDVQTKKTLAIDEHLVSYY